MRLASIVDLIKFHVELSILLLLLMPPGDMFLMVDMKSTISALELVLCFSKI